MSRFNGFLSTVHSEHRAALPAFRTAETPVASTVHEPFGSPSGPGLFHVKGLQLPAYIQHVAHRLVAQGHPESKAIGMAVGIVRNWAHGHDGHGNQVHPDVQAAAVKAMAEWEAAKAAAHGKRFNPFHLGAGPGGGEFTSHGGAGSGSGKQAAAPVKAPKGTAGKTRAQHKQHLLSQAKDDRAKAHQLQEELKTLEHQHAQHVQSAKKAAATAKAHQKINPHAKHHNPGHKHQHKAQHHHPGRAAKHAQAAKAAAGKAKTLVTRIADLKKQIHVLLTAAASLEAQAKRL